jgi:hypothetical protein
MFPVLVVEFVCKREKSLNQLAVPIDLKMLESDGPAST